jgi:hypothetical protein
MKQYAELPLHAAFNFEHTSEPAAQGRPWLSVTSGPASRGLAGDKYDADKVRVVARLLACYRRLEISGYSPVSSDISRSCKYG